MFENMREIVRKVWIALIVSDIFCCDKALHCNLSVYVHIGNKFAGPICWQLKDVEYKQLLETPFSSTVVVGLCLANVKGNPAFL